MGDGFHCILSNLCTKTLCYWCYRSPSLFHSMTDPTAFEGAPFSQGAGPTKLQEAMQVCTLLFLTWVFLEQQNKKHTDP